MCLQSSPSIRVGPSEVGAGREQSWNITREEKALKGHVTGGKWTGTRGSGIDAACRAGPPRAPENTQERFITVKES